MRVELARGLPLCVLLLHALADLLLLLALTLGLLALGGLVVLRKRTGTPTPQFTDGSGRYKGRWSGSKAFRRKAHGLLKTLLDALKMH